MLVFAVGVLTCLQVAGKHTLPGFDAAVSPAFASSGTAYYVSPSGDDANNGLTPNSPWRTVGRVNAVVLHPGDRVLFEGGQTIQSAVPLRLDQQDSGTASNPITIGSYGTGSATLRVTDGDGIEVYWIGGVDITNLIVSGSGTATNHGNGIVFQTSSASPLPGRQDHVRVDNVDISGFGEHGIVLYGELANGYSNVQITSNRVHDGGRGGITLDGTSDAPNGVYPHTNVYVANNVVFNINGIAGQNSGSGITVSRTRTALVERNVAHDNGLLGGTSSGGPVGIWSYESDRAAVQFNESYANRSAVGVDGDGFDLDGGSTNSVVQYNYSHDNDGSGFLLAQFPSANSHTNNVVRYNISQNDNRRSSTGSIGLWNGGSGVSNAEIYNNTIYVSPPTSGAAAAIKFLSPSNNIHLRNNILVTAGGVPLVSVPPGQNGLLLQGNDYWPSGASFAVEWAGTTYSTLSAFRNAAGQETNAGSPTGSSVDPGLTNPGSGGTIGDPDKLPSLTAYRLQAGSPLIGAALNLRTLFGIDTGTRDFYGDPLGTTISVGSYEYSAVVPTATPYATPTTAPVASPPSSAPTATPPPGIGLSAGLVLYYKMDEVSWTGTAGQVADASGWANGGTARNGATTGPGRFGNGGAFDGRTAFVDAGKGLSTDLSGPMTVAAWVRLSALPTRLTDLVIKGSHLAPRQSYELLYDPQTNRFGFTIADSVGHYPGSTGPSTVSSGIWYHVVGVYDGVNVVTYVDGVAGQSVAYTSLPYLAIGTLAIADEGDGETALPGTLDEVRVYNRALSAAEVAQLYAFDPTALTTPTAPPPRTSTPPPTPTSTASPIPTSTQSASSTPTSTSSASPIPTSTAVPTGTQAASPTPTSTVVPTRTPAVSPTPTSTPARVRRHKK